MSKKAKNGANKKLHSKLLKQKKDKELSSKAKRKALMRKLNQKAFELNSSVKSSDTEEE